MRRSFLANVPHGAEALAAHDGAGALPDADLLKRFAAGRDPAAFAVLVRRHGPLVWGVCRTLLPADADAEDAFQATFLALCRSAGSIRRGEALAGWLHGVAYRVALKARRAAARRRKREAAAAAPEHDTPVSDAAWDELQAAVHAEVCRLPARLRLPFVLCGLQGRPQKEAAAALGWTVAGVSSRLSEARRVLLARLARRGVPAGVAAGAAVLGGAAGRAAVPPTVRLKALAAAGDPAAAPPNVRTLARGVTPMTLTRTQVLAAGLALAGLLTTSVGVLSQADAQAPPDDRSPESVRRALDSLRTRPAADRWEYKFIPVEKALTLADLQTVLAGADREGWSYCGSQDLAQEKSGRVTPHMVFKRPRAGAAGDRADETAALLGEVRSREAAARERAEAEARSQRAAAERALRLAEERAAAERAARAEAARERDAAAAERQRAEEAFKAAARGKAADADNRAGAAKAREREIEALRAEYEAVIRSLREELKAKAGDAPAGPTPAKK